MTLPNESNRTKPNWKQVGTFLGVTFGLTYLLNLILYLAGGYGGNPATTLLLQVQMLIPAGVAIILQLWVFQDGPLYRLREPTRWFFYGYLIYAAIHLGIAVSAMLIDNQTFRLVASAAIQLLLVVVLLLIVLLRLVAGKEAFRKAGLAGGRFWYYISFGLLVVAIYALMTGLNALFGTGQPVDTGQLLDQLAGGQAAETAAIPQWLLLAIVGFQSVILGPVLALPIAFGEEYGWRGYLQGELVKLGKVRGILWVGVIWGLWHAPIIAMGHNYPGYPLLGILLMTLYTVALSFLFGYAVLKSGSVWLAAFLHGLNNQVAAFLLVMVYTPGDPVFSFGVGLYGLAVWAIVVAGLLLLDRKIWTSPSPLFSAGDLRAFALQAQDVPELQRFFEANPEYFLAVEGRPPGPDAAVTQFRNELPAGYTYTKSWLLGFVDDANSLAGMASLVSDFSAPGVWHIGIFIVATERHGSGDALALYRALEEWMGRGGAQWVRLAVVEGNVRAERFWEKAGFTEVRRHHAAEMGQRLNTLRIMVKPLAGGALAGYYALIPRDRPET